MKQRGFTQVDWKSNVNPYRVANKASLACGESTDAADDEELETTWSPESVTALTQAWDTEVLNTGQQMVTATMMRTYTRCLSGEMKLKKVAGVNAAPADVAAVIDEARPRLALQGSKAPRAVKTESPEWTAFEAQAEDFASAHSQCQQPVLRATAAALGTASHEFLASHSAEVRAAKKHWQDIRAEARRLTGS